MSLATWIKEFYPVEAVDCTEEDYSVFDAIQQSLTKWIGLRPENVKKHGLIYRNHGLVDERNQKAMYMDGSTCSLCVRYASCRQCPIYKTSGESCSSTKTDSNNAYYVGRKNPEPMIELLQFTMVYANNHVSEFNE